MISQFEKAPEKQMLFRCFLRFYSGLVGRKALAGHGAVTVFQTVLLVILCPIIAVDRLFQGNSGLFTVDHDSAMGNGDLQQFTVGIDIVNFTAGRIHGTAQIAVSGFQHLAEFHIVVNISLRQLQVTVDAGGAGGHIIVGSKPLRNSCGNVPGFLRDLRPFR